MKVGLVIPEMESHSTRVFADMVQNHPRTMRERPIVLYRDAEAPDLSVSGMAVSMLAILFPILKLEPPSA
jgi:hypothetical protein